METLLAKEYIQEKEAETKDSHENKTKKALEKYAIEQLFYFRISIWELIVKFFVRIEKKIIELKDSLENQIKLSLEK